MEVAMYRIVFLLCAVVACRAAQVTEFVNCGGATQTAVINLPQEPLTTLRCDDQNGVTAISGPAFGPIGMNLVAVPFPSGPQLPPANVEATYSIVGNFVIQPLAMAAYWSVCFREDLQGTGTASASGSFGPGTTGGLCNFAHAVPFPSSGTATFPVDMSSNAAGNAEFQVVALPQFFDVSGNALDDSFSLSVLPSEVPEPSTIITAALAYIGIRLTRRGV
jgi:hypothetical protein